jgi:hypothetical protein
LQGLDSDSKAALGLIYMRNGEPQSSIQLEESEGRALERLGSSLGGSTTALESLNGSLVQHAHIEGASIWRFKHPTIGDALAAQLVRNPELLEIYIQGSPAEDLIQQVTCGDVGLERAVVIPKSLFALILKQLDEYSSSPRYKSRLYATWGARSRVMDFLARRCSKEFLLFYVKKHPELPDRVADPGLMLSAVSEVGLAARLHKYGLLPEPQRLKFLETVTGYALRGEDFDALSDYDIKSIFTDQEFEDFREQVRTELVPRLADVRRDWQSNYIGSDNPADSFMEPLRDSLKVLVDEFAGDDEVKTIVDRETDRLNDWVAEHSEEKSDDKPARKLGDVGTPDQFGDVRSIFDDIDV